MSDGGEDEKDAAVNAASIMRNLRERYRRSALLEGAQRKGTAATSSTRRAHRGASARAGRLRPLGAIEDENTPTYVLLHELAHLGTDEVGHASAFWDTFRLIMDAAESAGVYRKVHYGARPKGYCGIKITSNAAFPRRGSHGTRRGGVKS